MAWPVRKFPCDENMFIAFQQANSTYSIASKIHYLIFWRESRRMTDGPSRRFLCVVDIT